MLPRHGVQGQQGFVANAARRDVDDPIQAGFVGGVMGQAQEGDDVLDLAAPVEPLRTDKAVRQPRLEEGFLDQAGLRIGAIHHRAIASFELARGNQLGDRIHHESSLGIIIRRFVKEDLLSLAAVCEQLLALAVQGAVDDPHGRV